MPRDVPEWVGATDDTRIPDRVRIRIFDRYHGRCQCGCNRKIMAGERWDAEHTVAIINGGLNCESNLTPFLAEHHKSKTARDVAIKSKTARVRKKSLGIRKPRTIRSWRRFDGSIVTAARQR